MIKQDSFNGSLQINNRRNFLRTSLQLGAAAVCASQSAVTFAGEKDRSLRLINDHTWEKLDIVYWTRGVYVDESLAAINHLMRDHRANLEFGMDVNLLDQLYVLHSKFDIKEPLHILSGYRTPATNAKLRKRSSGVAKYSLHMEGKAADIYIPGISSRKLQKAALSMKAGGVGYYGKSGFVHVDTGRVRQWQG